MISKNTLRSDDEERVHDVTTRENRSLGKIDTRSNHKIGYLWRLKLANVLQTVAL